MIKMFFLLFERIGLLLMVAYLITRIPFLKALLYRRYRPQSWSVYLFVFILLTIISTHLSIIIHNDEVVNRHLLILVEPNSILFNLSIIVVSIAGLWGGVFSGIVVSVFASLYFAIIGGQGVLIYALTTITVGGGFGYINKYFFKENLISPVYALFLGLIPPILYLTLMGFRSDLFSAKVLLSIGVPYIITVSIAIGIFTSIIHIIFKEEGNEIVLATNQAFSISEDALPILKYNTRIERSEALAKLLYERLKVSAIVITKQDEVIATTGLNRNYHKRGDRLQTSKTFEVLRTRKMRTIYFNQEQHCANHFCPYEAAIIIPIVEPNDRTSVIKLYFKKANQISPVNKVIAQGIGQLFSIQLKVHASEQLKANILDAELRNLQAQINPHFLFNTLHLIASLFRVDPLRARNITIQLANFMRFNLGITSKSLIPLKEECEHLKAYLDIVEARFSNRIKINYYMDHSLNSASVFIPPSTIQPIVENSIQHGLGKTVVDGKINIRIEELDKRIVVSVMDNGVGFTEEAKQQVIYNQQSRNNFSGIGLYNVNHRLISLLDDQAKLSIENLPSGGSKVSFSIPNQSYGGENNED